MATQVMRMWPVLLAGLLSLAAPSSRAAKPEEAPAESLKTQAQNAFWWGDFAEMERLFKLHQQAGLEPDRAYTLLRDVRNGFHEVLDGHKGDGDAYHAELDALTLQWAKQNPDSVLAHTLHASALTSHAWAYRGKDYANAVPPQAWADFRKYIQQAKDYLLAHEKVAFSQSSGHHQMIVIGTAAGWKPTVLWSLAKEGLKRNPNDLGLYYRVLTGTLPKWHGDTRAVDNYILEVAASTKGTRGMEMYTRLYASASQEHYKHQLFENSYATWPKMKAGYEDMLKRDPRPYTHNEMAYFACLAQDKETFLAQLEAIGKDKPDLSAWGSNARYTYDTCKRWGTQL